MKRTRIFHTESQTALQKSKATVFYTYALLIVVIFLKPFSNLFFAEGVKSFGKTLSSNPATYVEAMLHPLVAAAIALQLLWLLCRMALLSRADLSFVLPATASGYVLSAVLGCVFLAEQITLEHWAGILLIFAGGSFVGATRPDTTSQASTKPDARPNIIGKSRLPVGNIAD